MSVESLINSLLLFVLLIPNNNCNMLYGVLKCVCQAAHKVLTLKFELQMVAAPAMPCP